MNKPKTAKSLGFAKGDFVLQSGFPSIIIGGAHTTTPTVEAWGYEHECGTCYAYDLKRLTPEQFIAECAKLGHKQPLTSFTDEGRMAIQTLITAKP